MQDREPFQDSWVTFNPSHYVQFRDVPSEFQQKDGTLHPRYDIRMEATCNVGDQVICLSFSAYDRDEDKQDEPFLTAEVPFEVLERMVNVFSSVVEVTPDDV